MLGYWQSKWVIVDNVGLNKERVLPGTSRAAQADACDMCCSAPLISYFCPRLCQPASIPATSQPASTSLLLGQRLSKGIILLFPTPLSLHPSVFLFPSLAQVRPSLARPSPVPLLWRPSRRRSLQKSGRLSDALTLTPQDKFINLLQLRSQFLHKPQTRVFPGTSPVPHVKRAHMAAIHTSPVV